MLHRPWKLSGWLCCAWLAICVATVGRATVIDHTSLSYQFSAGFNTTSGGPAPGDNTDNKDVVYRTTTPTSTNPNYSLSVEGSVEANPAKLGSLFASATHAAATGEALTSYAATITGTYTDTMFLDPPSPNAVFLNLQVHAVLGVKSVFNSTGQTEGRATFTISGTGLFEAPQAFLQSRNGDNANLTMFASNFRFGPDGEPPATWTPLGVDASGQIVYDFVGYVDVPLLPFSGADHRDFFLNTSATAIGVDGAGFVDMLSTVTLLGVSNANGDPVQGVSLESGMTLSAVPEASSFLAIGLAAVAAGVGRWRSKRRQESVDCIQFKTAGVVA